MTARIWRWLRCLVGQAVTAVAATTTACDQFKVKELRGSRCDRIVSPIFNWFARYPQRECWMRPLRWICPILRIGCVLVLRDEDVREVLAHDREFPVPWGGRMVKVTGSRNFVLGMKADAEYWRNYAQIANAFKREDVSELIVPQAAAASESILRTRARLDPDSGKLRIDAVRELMWGVPAQLCEDYVGISIPDKFLFSAWTVAMSRYLFGTCSNKLNATGMDLALAAADCFRNLIRIAIGNAHQGRSPGVVLPRLITMQASDPWLTDDVIEAHLFGMVTGFIPTDLLAGSHMLDTLLRRKFRPFMERTHAAALAGDDDLLWRCLQETLRFRHFNFGAFRNCGPQGYKLAAGTRREKYPAPGAKVLAATQSAMFDTTRVVQPKVFNPDRPAEDYLGFGYGQHWCVGKYIAIAQITETFKALLRRRNLKRAPGPDGKLQMNLMVYPANLTVEFDP